MKYLLYLLAVTFVALPVALYGSNVNMTVYVNNPLVADPVDHTPPTVTSFSVVSTPGSLAIAVGTFVATDNVGVTGYLINESPSTPADNDPHWSSVPQTSYAFLTEGNKTLYAWAKDANANISLSVQVPLIISAGGGSTPPPAGGGGGGGSPPPSSFTPATPTIPTSVVVRGVAYPGSSVVLLKDSQVIATTQAGPDARFEIVSTNVSGGTYTFSVWAKDSTGVRSDLFPFTVSLTPGVTSVISGIFIAPTISLDKEAVRHGDLLTIIGHSAPSADVSLVFHSDTEIVKKTQADESGAWTYLFDTLPLELGGHTSQARSQFKKDISNFSKQIAFSVGDKNIKTKKAVEVQADQNNDGKVDLSDFSIMLYWYKRPLTKNTPASVDLNHDGKVDLIDFSILAYYWTG